MPDCQTSCIYKSFHFVCYAKCLPASYWMSGLICEHNKMVLVLLLTWLYLPIGIYCQVSERFPQFQCLAYSPKSHY